MVARHRKSCCDVKSYSSVIDAHADVECTMKTSVPSVENTCMQSDWNLCTLALAGIEGIDSKKRIGAVTCSQSMYNRFNSGYSLYLKMFSATAGPYGSHLESLAWISLRAKVVAVPQVSLFHVGLSNEYSWFSVTGNAIITGKLVNPVQLPSAQYGSLLLFTLSSVSHTDKYRNRHAQMQFKRLANWKQISFQFPHNKTVAVVIWPNDNTQSQDQSTL